MRSILELVDVYLKHEGNSLKGLTSVKESLKILAAYLKHDGFDIRKLTNAKI